MLFKLDTDYVAQKHPCLKETRAFVCLVPGILIQITRISGLSSLF